MLADGFCATNYFMTGDHDYKRDCLLLENINSTLCCSHCKANRTTIPWFDFSLFARWTTSPSTKELLCPLFGPELGLSRKNVAPDWMHDKYLGTDKVPVQREGGGTGGSWFLWSVTLSVLMSLLADSSQIFSLRSPMCASTSRF